MKHSNKGLRSSTAVFLRHAFGPIVLSLVLLALPLVTAAQLTTATLVGAITDPGGANVPSASVTARNTETGLTRTATTDADGNYRIDVLPVGNYEIEVSATSGFKKALQKGVVLRVNDTARVDMTLEVGAVSEQVTVTTAPPEINTSTTELGRTVQSQEIENLPLVERNIYTLLDLTPGVQSNNTGIATASASTSNLSLGFPEQRTLINGGTDGGTGSVNYYLDGGTNMTNLRNTGNGSPNPDTVQEFRVQTNSYNAEYGRFASGIINVLTKSGTNRFHGSLYEFVRNTVFNANEWGSSLQKAPYHRNQFGGTIGGPIKTDKTFFFASYSGLRQITSTFLSGAIVPTAAERAGDFRASSGAVPKDPATGTSLLTATTFSCLGVSGVICANRIDPVARKIIDTYIPLPNVVIPGRGLIGWQGNVANPFNTNEFLGKIDHQLNEAHRLTLSYFTTAGSTTVFPGSVGSSNVAWATQDYKWRQHNVNLSDVWVIGSDKVNQVWLTYTRNFGGRLNVPSTSLRDLGSSFFPQGTPSLPQITVTGYFTLQNAIGGPTAGTNLYSMRDVFSWNRGRHSLKLGGELSLNKDIQQTLLNNYGVFGFNNTSTGNGFADFLVGMPSSIAQDAPVIGYTNTWYTALFVQDDFRIKPRLTLNLGLRWDVQTPPTDPQNRVVNYVPGQQSTVNPIAPVGALFYGDPGVERGGIPVSFSHFSPRFGIAWDPFGDGRTSVRAAAGIFYGSISGNEWNTMTNFQPFAIRLNPFTNINRRQSAAGVPLGASLSNPYNNYTGGTPFPYNGTFLAPGAGGGVFAVAPDFTWPRTFQTNVSIQREVLKDLTLGAAYVGTISHDLPFGRDVNYPVATPTATSSNAQSRRPNNGFGAVTVLDSDQDASYHALQLTGTYRLGTKVHINGFYTFSKTLSSAELHNNTTQGLAQNYVRLGTEKGLADSHQAHVFSVSMNFELDYYKGDNRYARGILNGWSLAPIIKLRSGRPFSVTNGGVDANLDGTTGTDRAQLVGDPHLDNPSPDMWFNINAFRRNLAVTGAPVEGNSARNLLIGPGYHAVDLALSRDFRFGERYKVRIRAEGTNIFNNVNLDQPNASVPANIASPGNFGRITSAGAMRRIQFGARLTF
jgi:hypothetical protein